jgi:hypothetical protein
VKRESKKKRKEKKRKLKGTEEVELYLARV